MHVLPKCAPGCVRQRRGHLEHILQRVPQMPTGHHVRGAGHHVEGIPGREALRGNGLRQPWSCPPSR